MDYERETKKKNIGVRVFKVFISINGREIESGFNIKYVWRLGLIKI